MGIIACEMSFDEVPRRAVGRCVYASFGGRSSLTSLREKGKALYILIVESIRSTMALNGTFSQSNPSTSKPLPNTL